MSSANRLLPYIMVGLFSTICITDAMSENMPPKKRASEETTRPIQKKKSIEEPPTTKAKQPEIEQKTELASKSPSAPNVSLIPEDLLEFSAQPASVKKLIESCLELAKQNITYAYGSSDPKTGGLDCSGFIYYVLRQHGFAQVPRDSSGQYVWVRSARGFRAVIGRKIDSFEMDELLPGDLLFWTGTYATDHDPPISHVMIYLGTEKSTSAKVMIGSSDGRTYHSIKRNGVSVFDFNMPRASNGVDQRSNFVGYGRIPGLRE